MSISKIMNKLRKIASVLMLAVAVAFAAGCTKPDEPNNGGNDNGGGNSISSCELANVHIVYGGLYHGVTYSNDNGNMDLTNFPE